MLQHNKKHYDPAVIIRALLLGWLTTVTIEYLLSSRHLDDLTTIAGMNLMRVILLTLVLTAVFLWCNMKIPIRLQRWLFPGVILLLCAASLIPSYQPVFLAGCGLLFLLAVFYAILGWKSDPASSSYAGPEPKIYRCIVAILAILFFIFVSTWTVCRVLTYSTPTYDFGIFSQMFHNMKENGLPLTTVERDGLLSHFKVHMSPVYYLLLPFYYIVPTPATLQVLQAAVLASSAIPMWLLSKKHGLSPILRVLVCLLLFLYPAFSGGTSYDIHENAFLTPLILWLLYAIDTEKSLLIGLFALLVLTVKEDAAVYTAVIGLFVVIGSLVHRDGIKRTITGLLILLCSMIWFLIVTAYLSNSGDGVMTYRYDNFIYDGSGSLLTVIKAVIMCPMKVLYECTDPEKFKFIVYTMLPLLGIPIFTRRYERYILLIPYLLINLMSDYQYQHSIFFQYNFGSTAFLFYLIIVNLADLKNKHFTLSVSAAAVVIAVICFISTVVPVAVQYPQRYHMYKSTYQQTQQVLDTIPDDASVAATTFYTTPLSQRSELYDVRYTSTETVLNCNYVVLAAGNQSCYKKYETANSTGFDALVNILLENGFTLESQLDGVLLIYRKP